mgnify:CR=1 FL=1
MNCYVYHGLKSGIFTLLCIFYAFTSNISAQVNFTANDLLIPYEGYFRQGVNPGYYGPKWDDSTLGDIAAGNNAAGVEGVGVRAIRGSLPESIGLVFGYDIWKDKYEYNEALGLTDNTLFLGFAHPDHKDPVDYCPGDNFQTDMFANLYEPIWDDNNGTAINENNYYATYVYEVVSRLKNHVKFWEIWNEPGFDFTGAKGWLPRGAPGNWWENNPDPCDYKLRAPVFHYIRLLRISYDVIKTLAPDDYIVVAGVGYDSFLDVILRNTDNPVDGSVTPEYPLTGGAYFEVLGFHAYPHFDGSTRAWNNNTQSFDYFRHTDAAIEGLETKRDARQDLLAAYGYDGITYPKKEWTVTEINVPRKPILGEWGSEEVQRNYVIKAVVKAIELNFVNIHIYNLAEIREESAAGNEFDLLGFYKNLNNVESFDQEMLDSGVAYRTVSEMLFETVFDKQQTALLNLPADVKGGAFKKADGKFVYVLWARTSIDKSEDASANYSFPSGLNVQTFAKRSWDHAKTDIISTIPGSNITLSGSPIFLIPSLENNTTTIELDCTMGIEIIGQALESEGGAMVSWLEPTATTNCNSGVSMTQSIGPPNGGFFPFGVTEVQYKATNACGDEEICAFNVKVASNGGGGIGDCHIYRWNLGFMGSYNGHKYFLSINKATWDEAQVIAAQHGGYLASIDDAAENEFIKGQAYNLAYIGLNDAQVEGNLSWPSGANTNYTNIADCTGCQNSDRGDYAILNYFNGTWYFVDGSTEEYFIVELPCGDADNDGDGYNVAIDCDDNNPNIYPGAVEVANNNIDEDCDGSDLTVLIDIDGDGFDESVDCNDMDGSINPDAEEIANNDVDEDCDGVALIIDVDGDGFNSDEDCDDTNADVNPDAEEIVYNGFDDDCNENTLDDDLDQDGFMLQEDCDDKNANINPDAIEIPGNGIDEDCDGIDGTTSIKGINEIAFKVLPNPCKDYFLVEHNLEEIEIEVYDLLGEIVFKSSIETQKINTNNWPPGTYLIMLIDSKTTTIKSYNKLIKL